MDDNAAIRLKDSPNWLFREARRMMLTPDEIEAVLRMRADGRTFSYIEQELRRLL